MLEGLTQQDMANLLKISIQSYNKKENGRVSFTANELEFIATLFGVPMENFFAKQVANA
jgi:transcriptional regulator with XRE-family HTH domain